MTSRSLAALAALAMCFGCQDEPGSVDRAKKADTKKAATEPPKSKVIKTPVAWGAKLPCEKILDAAQLAALLGKGELTIADISKSDQDATSICQVKLAGTPPSEEEQKKAWVKNGRVLGVLPGDEICMVTLTCGFVFDVAEERKKCESKGQTVSTEVGELTCLEKFEAGPDYKHVFTALDADTKCKIKVNPGPSVVDEATPKACLKAAADLIGPANLKVE